MVDFPNIELVLGSASPRRVQLMQESGYVFAQRIADVEEVFPDDLPIEQVAQYLAKLKSDAIAISDKEVLITADSIVAINNLVLGKPRDKAEAQSFLKMLSDTVHIVYTGICIRNKAKEIAFTVTSKVTMSPLSDAEIDYYIDTCKPYDKAGAYGIQDWIGHCKVAHIDGSYTNIMGLPMAEVYRELNAFIEDGL